MKVSGLDFKRFWSDPIVWGPESSKDHTEKPTYADDVLLKVDGVDFDGDETDIPDGAVVQIECGYLCNPQPKCPESLDKALTWWWKRQSKTVVLVEVDSARMEELNALLKGIGAVRLLRN